MRINCHRTGHNRCSRLRVHVTDNQTGYRAPPLRGQNSVLDESRQSVQDRAAEFTMIAARQRLERLIRAGSSLLNQSNNRPGMGLDKTERPRSAG